MATPAHGAQRMQLAQKTRERFLADAQKILVELGGLVQDRLTVLLNERGTTRDMQNRRDAWMLFQKQRMPWIDGTMKVWQEALKSPAGKKSEKKKDELALEGDGGLSLVGTDAVENKILASRLVLAGSETSAVAPGYLAGAVDAAEAAVFTLRARQASARTTDAG